MIHIYGKNKESFCKELTKDLGKGEIYAKKLYQAWMNQGRLLAEEEVEPQARKLLKELISRTDFSLPVVEMPMNQDQTYKYLLRLHDQLAVEFVVIPMQAGATLCISSQVGCLKGCRFCSTGTMGLIRNLETYEIVAQVYHAIHTLKNKIRNIVFMGMGEPFDNFDNVMQAISILTDPHGLALGKRHISVSTSGVVDKIYRFADEADEAINLAVSVNAPNDEIRTKIMPVNRKWNMASLKEAMQYYLKSPKREILAEYVLLAGVNDQDEHAHLLCDYLENLRVKINVIPYNSGVNSRFTTSSQERIDRFMQILRSRNFCTLLRQTKGEKIMAACGQLVK
ncbi:MAG: 23S rRNA (adenine(2503)-C(2))-methyltransferase RlmN [Chlamydiae bacterium]|nr:23S rRNA (adenine(2503)-C(2))-methyltransferase RlmN [Chlamydiota bacterium]